ncbi:hypothetical protein I2485_08580 [Nesterenkonia sp. E16_7]|uniref:pilus assembly protein TadG-related protein n=1 Tax=unclassified Nesterenkonia TaxID=2629769 RepID=UPI001A912473|nr:MULTISPECIES: hypothetical protein [unclassified Nesterenkonia]MBO0595054.1 hypothetical protein [Nesterenkonia sp. E16_10]MBO0598709.1 hypothetical protein [Nesterenkonia sp. E16_7]
MEVRSRQSGVSAVKLRRLEQEDAGQSSILILGMLLVVLLLVSVMAGATAVNLEARKLLSAADGAASAAAQAAEQGASGAGPRVNSDQVLAQAQNYLAVSGADRRFSDLAVSRTWVTDTGETAHVELAAVVDLPLVSVILPAQVPITVESHARVSLNR